MFNLIRQKSLIVFLEKFGVIIITILISVIIYIMKFNIFNFKESSGFFSNILSFSSILLGIVITMATLFLGYSNKQVVKKIKLRSADKLMFKYFLVPISTGIMVAVGSICLGLLSGENILSISLQLKLTIVYGIISTLFFLATIRIFLLMLIILKDVFRQDMNYQENTKNNIDNSTDNVEVYFDDSFK
ncbi:hypothetical protein [Clostridium botulinum]|uniref:hypothetical protein n=1 Tax=Clostridium botulinum TaxID=1491 RepID=UPI00069A5D21|nr:hypothetical protein [Clostridium botulinum]KOA89592.1 hypothetical protein ADU76_14325 [Clostridium botulinum]MCD3203449.1 hypothetical protein [Clostridium botulinum C/D]MCD3222312.1 hypothetical protein [Clostridium botulinum C/D]MCD3231418.1 hypothetical protein [Clostridium botulinum C/D]MCD3273085.1 hypothetical protein [Clostridium botulinum C/D]